jgi:hypothetical protein
MASETSTSASVKTLPVLAAAAPMRSPRIPARPWPPRTDTSWRWAWVFSRQPSGSALAVATACSASAALPRAYRATQTLASILGLVNHIRTPVVPRKPPGRRRPGGPLPERLRHPPFSTCRERPRPIAVGFQGPVRIRLVEEPPLVIGAHCFRKGFAAAVLDAVRPAAGPVHPAAGRMNWSLRKRHWSLNPVFRLQA